MATSCILEHKPKIVTLLKLLWPSVTLSDLFVSKKSCYFNFYIHKRQFLFFLELVSQNVEIRGPAYSNSPNFYMQAWQQCSKYMYWSSLCIHHKALLITIGLSFCIIHLYREKALLQRACITSVIGFVFFQPPHFPFFADPEETSYHFYLRRQIRASV